MVVIVQRLSPLSLKYNKVQCFGCEAAITPCSPADVFVGDGSSSFHVLKLFCVDICYRRFFIFWKLY